MSIRLLVLGDLHLGAQLPEWRSLGARRREDLASAFRVATALAVDPREEVDAVLVCGDLLDRPDPSPETADLVAGGLAAIVERGIPVVVLPGDCDPLDGASLEYGGGCLPDGVTLIRSGVPERQGIPLRDGKLNLHTFTRVPGVTPADPGAALGRVDGDGVHVGLFHAELIDDGAAPRSPVALPLTRGALADSGLNVAIVGRGHAFHEERAGDTTIVVPGSPVGLGPNETGERGFTLIALDGDAVQVERRPTGAPRVVACDVEVAAGDTAETIVARVRRNKDVAFARVRLTGVQGPALDLEAAAARLAAANITVDWVDQTDVVTGGGTADDAAVDPVVQLFITRMRERIAAAVSDEERGLLAQALRAGVGAWRDRDGHHAA